MEHRAADPPRPQSSHPVTPSIILADSINTRETSDENRKDPGTHSAGRDSFYGTDSTEEEGTKEREAGEGQESTGSAGGSEAHPSTAGEMDQSEPAEEQGRELGPAPEKAVDREAEEGAVEEAAEALEMEDEAAAEEEEGEKQKRTDPKQLPAESPVGGTHQETAARRGHEICQDAQVQMSLVNL